MKVEVFHVTCLPQAVLHGLFSVNLPCSQKTKNLNQLVLIHLNNWVVSQDKVDGDFIFFMYVFFC